MLTIKYHFVMSTVNDGKIYRPIDQMVADVMIQPATKFNLVEFALFMFEVSHVYEDLLYMM